MTLARPNLFKLLAVAATFVAALGAFALITRSGDGAARSGPSISHGKLPRPGGAPHARLPGRRAGGPGRRGPRRGARRRVSAEGPGDRRSRLLRAGRRRASPRP